MTDVLDDVRDHYRAAGLTERLKTALTTLGPEDQRLTPQQLAGLDQFHTLGLAATAELAKLAGIKHVAMNISDRARLYREIRRVLKPGGRFATFDVVLNSGEPHYPVPWARTSATNFLLTAAATREAVEPAGFRTLAWKDDTEAAKAWFAQMRASGPPPSPNLGVVMGPEFAQLAANLGRNLMEGRLGVLTAVFEAA